MSTVLHVAASPRGASSVSRRIAAGMIEEIEALSGGLRVVLRDLAASPPPHPSAGFVAASLTPPDRRDDRAELDLRLSDHLIGELEDARAVVISTPMHNFTVPSALKAWIDLVVRPGRTFGFGPDGKRGLLADRPVRVIVACGGRFGDNGQPDFLEPYLRHVLGTMGLRDIGFLRLEELNRGQAAVARALDTARAWTGAEIPALLARS
ncbi:MAG: FMN-dependent NADH-azoreductase [Telmatospirillum sp.]|nr:FMN-dependent NADH-azoreductase [Telmatospirillum sp.]